MAELGNLVARYFPPSAGNVNCENPRRKPVSHLPRPNWGCLSGFWRTWRRFPTPSTIRVLPSQDVHRPPAFPACAKHTIRCKVGRVEFSKGLEGFR